MYIYIYTFIHIFTSIYDSLLFLFEQTHNYYVDNQGLLPWRLRDLGVSMLQSSFGLIGEDPEWWQNVFSARLSSYAKSSHPTTIAKNSCLSYKKTGNT